MGAEQAKGNMGSETAERFAGREIRILRNTFRRSRPVRPIRRFDVFSVAELTGADCSGAFESSMDDDEQAVVAECADGMNLIGRTV
jgi:hypothetical protein